MRIGPANYVLPALAIVLGTVLLTGRVAVSADGGALFSETCQKKCHETVTPDMMTKDQWGSFITGGEHDIFEDLSSHLPEDQKAPLLEFLKANAADAQRDAEGIGVWK